MFITASNPRQPYFFSAIAPPAWANFQVGDHVSVHRGFYWHHAIYVGNGVLIEFGSGVFGGRVAYVKWDAFSQGTSVNLERRGGWAAAQRAESQLGRNDFNVVTRNCQHFANWCTTGSWESGQVQIATGLVLAGLLLFLARKAA
jgi:HRAS-like suppressor 3